MGFDLTLNSIIIFTYNLHRSLACDFFRELFAIVVDALGGSQITRVLFIRMKLVSKINMLRLVLSNHELQWGLHSRTPIPR